MSRDRRHRRLRPFPLITDETLADLRARIGGQEFDRPHPHVTEATRDSIRHWVAGIGDENSLWLDDDYAARSRWGGITAPGSFLYAFDRVVSGYVAGLPGIHAMFAGTDWNWFAPIRLGDRITARPVLKDLLDLENSFSGRSVKRTYEVTFRNQDGDAGVPGRLVVHPHPAQRGPPPRGRQLRRAPPVVGGRDRHHRQALRERAAPRSRAPLLGGHRGRGVPSARVLSSEEPGVADVLVISSRQTYPTPPNPQGTLLWRMGGAATEIVVGSAEEATEGPEQGASADPPPAATGAPAPSPASQQASPGQASALPAHAGRAEATERSGRRLSIARESFPGG